MEIVQIKRTKLSEAPDLLSEAINKYTKHNSVVQRKIDTGESKYDAVIFHNKYIPTSIKNQSIIYHSEPYMVDLKIPNSVKKHVIAQYQSTLPQFSNCDIVRNIVDFNNPIYNPQYFSKIKIGYSPSFKNVFGEWHNKGFKETKEALERIKKIYDYRVDYDIITDVPLEECLIRKSKCNIIIDEVVTGSYHRSGLEGLAMGKLTICNLSHKVKDVLANVSGTNEIPFKLSNAHGLTQTLIDIIENGIDYINDVGKNNRVWMENHWNPETIVNEFIKKIEKNG